MMATLVVEMTKKDEKGGKSSELQEYGDSDTLEPPLSLSPVLPAPSIRA